MTSRSASRAAAVDLSVVRDALEAAGAADRPALLRVWQSGGHRYLAIPLGDGESDG